MTVEVDDLLLICAFRYALGRQSYVVGTVAEELIRLAPTMRRGDRALIVREIDEAIRLDAIGMEIDKQDWAEVRAVMEAAL